MAYIDDKQFDLNAASNKTTPLALDDAKTVAYQLTLELGTIGGGFVLTIEGSIDGGKYVTTGTSLTSEGVTSPIDCTKFRFTRGTVTGVNGSAATATISAISKP